MRRPRSPAGLVTVQGAGMAAGAVVRGAVFDTAASDTRAESQSSSRTRSASSCPRPRTLPPPSTISPSYDVTRRARRGGAARGDRRRGVRVRGTPGVALASRSARPRAREFMAIAQARASATSRSLEPNGKAYRDPQEVHQSCAAHARALSRCRTLIRKTAQVRSLRVRTRARFISRSRAPCSRSARSRPPSECRQRYATSRSALSADMRRSRT